MNGIGLLGVGASPVASDLVKMKKHEQFELRLQLEAWSFRSSTDGTWATSVHWGFYTEHTVCCSILQNARKSNQIQKIVWEAKEDCEYTQHHKSKPRDYVKQTMITAHGIFWPLN